MDEKWLKLAEYCKGVSQLCQALAESIEKQTDIKAEKKAETKKEDEQSVTLEAVSALAKKKSGRRKKLRSKSNYYRMRG